MNDPSGTTNPLRAAYYADEASHSSARIVANDRLALDTYRVRMHCPAIAQSILPGQFLMLRLPGHQDPLLGRPMALYDVVQDREGRPALIDVVYLVMGKMTGRLAEAKAGDRLEVCGPLGNGFFSHPAAHLVMVAGGIGQTPFLALAQECLGIRRFGSPPRPTSTVDRVTFCYGVRTAELLAGVQDFERIGVDVRIATDDGTAGHHGLVTDLLHPLVDGAPDGCRVVCCGPEVMMEAVAGICADANVPCEVSLETPMACGIGICFSCVARIRQPDGTWDYKRTCVDGPVFSADRIEW